MKILQEQNLQGNKRNLENKDAFFSKCNVCLEEAENPTNRNKLFGSHALALLTQAT